MEVVEEEVVIAEVAEVTVEVVVVIVTRSRWRNHSCKDLPYILLRSAEHQTHSIYIEMSIRKNK